MAAPTVTINSSSTDFEASDDTGLATGDEVLVDQEVMLLDAGVKASLSTNLSNATNNDLVFTAVDEGSAGNSITIEYADPGTELQALSVDVTGTAIKVNLATGANPGHDVSTIASEVKTAIEADEEASALVTVANKAANNGTGLVADMNATPLAGGGFTVTRAQENTLADSHTSSDVLKVSHVQRYERGPAIYYYDTNEEPAEQTFTSINVISLITPVASKEVVDNYDDDLIVNGELVCYFDPGTKKFNYLGKMWDGTLLSGEETLSED